MSGLVHLPDGDILVYDAEGRGVILTRRRRRTFNPASHMRKVDAEMRLLEERTWAPPLRAFFVSLGTDVAKRMQSRSRRISKYARLEVRRTAEDVKREATTQANRMLSDVFDAEGFKEEFIKIVRPLYEETVLTALESTGVALSLDFNLAARPSVQRFLTRRANQLAGQVASTTYDDIKLALRDGIMKGESIPDLAARVQSKLQGSSNTRATTIARTETVSAYNGGVHSGAGELPPEIAAGMLWIAAIDERTRPDHADADGQVVRVGEPFIVGGEELEYPGDPNGSPENTINCRCATAILTPEDMEGRMVQTHTVSDVLIRMAVHGLSYRQALHVLRTSEQEIQ